MPCRSSTKVEAFFTIINNLEVTIHVSVNNVTADLFLKGIFITKLRIQLAWWLENNFKFTKLEVTFYRVNQTRSQLDWLFSKKKKDANKFFFRGFQYYSFFIKTLSKYFLIWKSTKLLGQPLFSKTVLSLSLFW